ncbi:peptidoglycan-binding protein [Chryseobacterium sp. ON_d1]|uniref:peptidoglycan-binding domain-containing protein n=1 Tax=Chryseobacterium sp. ON_d1 TaxID=2583211 RepID=UPI0011571602|nr:peptidoglycan-binding domain-containing protein [Chryseobacterium sp. ON_d1]GEJ44110.1 hypothetical protein CRS_07180 [Chryseobacterium sp. ON_d1]
MNTGKQLLEAARNHIGEKYVYGAIVPFENSDYKGPWDCAEFISWIVYQGTGIKIGIRGKEAYTGYWAKDAAAFCRKITINEASQTYGAILFRPPGYKGIKIGHIAFSDGKGGTVEAKSAKEGVCESTIKGRQWEYGFLINGVDYETNLKTVADYHYPSLNFYVKSPAMKHALVEEAKKKLSKLNLYHGSINEIYDSETAKAVVNYQNMKGLVVDGALGRDTLRSLKVRQYTTVEKSMIWFKQNFEMKIKEKLTGTPFDFHLIMAIAYQETGYVWSKMIGKTTLADLLMCCTGDTLDAPNRSAFPKDKAALLAHTDGDKMFLIAREALKNVGRWEAVYKKLYDTQPDKFCHGYGIFQYDLQFFKTNPGFFLNKEWGNIDKVIEMAVNELKAAQNRIPSYRGKNKLTMIEQIYVAIAYNKGTADVTKDFKQGYRNDAGKYYGEMIYEYYLLSAAL